MKQLCKKRPKNIDNPEDDDWAEPEQPKIKAHIGRLFYEEEHKPAEKTLAEKRPANVSEIGPLIITANTKDKK